VQRGDLCSESPGHSSSGSPSVPVSRYRCAAITFARMMESACTDSLSRHPMGHPKSALDWPAVRPLRKWRGPPRCERAESPTPETVAAPAIRCFDLANVAG
jgi:hypothetical protein